MSYRCLVLDHDDTVVNSTATVHYPCFTAYMKEFPPHYRCTLEEYFSANFHGTLEFFRDVVAGMVERLRAAACPAGLPGHGGDTVQIQGAGRTFVRGIALVQF